MDINGFLPNEIINAVLFVIIIVIYVKSLLDRKTSMEKKDRLFSMFLFYCAIYIGMMVIWFPVRGGNNKTMLLNVLSSIRVFAAMAAYLYFGLWLISFIEEKKLVHSGLKKAVVYGAVIVYLGSTVIYYLFHSAELANILIFCYYLMLEIIVLVYRSSLGLSYTIIITLMIVPMLLLNCQTWWNYTPANIYLVLSILIIYSRMWTVQREKYLEEARLLAERSAELENAKTKLVLSQIKPHFLYNTLSTITYLCTNSPKMAETLCLDFSSYLRGNLSALDSGTMVPFETEMEHVMTYLKIESVRFEERLQISYDLEAKNFKLPVLTVEPLVENAVKHGVCQKTEGGSVKVISRELEDAWQVCVEDDGVGFDQKSFDWTDEAHVGLRSVRKRIEIICGGTLSIESEVGKGTRALLSIPKMNKEIESAV